MDEKKVVQLDINALVAELNSAYNMILALKKENEKLKNELKSIENTNRNKINKSKNNIIERTAAEKRFLTGKKCNGVNIAHEAECIDTRTQFIEIQNNLINDKKYREWLLWSLGVATGLRISDLIQLKWMHVFDQSGNFRERFPKVEQKTGKFNLVLITDFIKDCIEKYINFTKINTTPSDYIFKSQKGYKYNPKLSPDENEILKINKQIKFGQDQISKTLKKYGRSVGLLHNTSHAMRKSFVHIAECFYDSSYSEQTHSAIQKVLLHSNPNVTTFYSKRFLNEYDELRQTVSDFLSGKIIQDEIVPTPQVTNKHIYDKLIEIEDKITNKIAILKED